MVTGGTRQRLCRSNVYGVVFVVFLQGELLKKSVGNHRFWVCWVFGQCGGVLFICLVKVL